jgi:suppressor of fused-like protein
MATAGAGDGLAAAAAHVDAVAGGPPKETFSPRRRGVVDEARIYALADPPSWHVVTLGVADLGFELTLRLPRPDDELPTWAVDCLVSLVAYARRSGHGFAAGDQIDLRGPIKLDSDTALTAAAIVVDPTLGTLGSVEFLQVVGLTADELELCRSWRTEAVLALLRRRDPMLTTVLDRPSLSADRELRDTAEAGVAAEGSSLDGLNVASLSWRRRGRTLVVTLGAGAATALGPALRRKLNHDGAQFVVAGDAGELRFVVAAASGWRQEDKAVVVDVPLAAVETVAALFSGQVGTGTLAEVKGLRFAIIA